MSTVSRKIPAKPPNRSVQVRKVVKASAIDQEQALRDQLHIEIENKSKACSNPTFECSIPRLEGYEYCIRHILQDSRAPYKQCAYIYQSGKKCTQAAPKHDIKKDPQLTTFCFEHSRLVQLTKTRNSVGKYKNLETNEALLSDLSHHLNIEKAKPTLSHSFSSDVDEEIDVVSPNVQPFVSYDHISDLDTINQVIKSKKRILDYVSDSTTSDDDSPCLNNTSKAHEWDNSDDESVDSQDEDVLKHAGIYTSEEVTLIAKQKLEKLQGLYMDQLSNLQYLLKEKRRRYLHAIRKERETLCSIHDQPKTTTHERKLYEKLKSLNHYHKRYGVEAVLYKKFKEKRSRAVEGYVIKNSGFIKCNFAEGGVKCLERALPSCKFCRKHILEDKKQILFRACAVEKSGIVCQEPVPNIFDESTCVLHINLPNRKCYTQKKYESETEEENEEEIVLKKEDLKVELMPEDVKMENTSNDVEMSSQIEQKAPASVDQQSFDENVTIAHETDETEVLAEIAVHMSDAAPATVEGALIASEAVKDELSIDHSEEVLSASNINDVEEAVTMFEIPKAVGVRDDKEKQNEIL